jgi:hypothetical protein
VIAAIYEKHEMSPSINDATAFAVALRNDRISPRAAEISAISQSAEIFLSACYFCSTTATAVVIAAIHVKHEMNRSIINATAFAVALRPDWVTTWSAATSTFTRPVEISTDVTAHVIYHQTETLNNTT